MIMLFDTPLFDWFDTGSSSNSWTATKRELHYRTESNDDGYKLIIDLPGKSKKDISLQYEAGNIVVFDNDKQIGKFRVPKGITAENISASMKHGQLCVIMKKEKEVLKIPIE